MVNSSNERFLHDLNEEKREIIRSPGNVLVVANPGTGKTKLLSYKFVWLVKQGIRPEDILCLTFTNKARAELEERIIDLMKREGFGVDVSKLKVHTFHSYTIEGMNEEDIVSDNLLRFSIYKFLKENKVLNYGDRYLIEKIVPQTSNLIRYLKNFGILPSDVDVESAKEFLEEDKRFKKHELEKFLKDFVNIFKHYESVKSVRGIDYADMLLNFWKAEVPAEFDYVLVDELQDVNNLEADIALKSAKNFVAVGDKKQAIMGFQGGSVINFKKFSHAKNFILSENFRSTNEVLSYAKNLFVARTWDEGHKKNLEGLRNNQPDATGEVPRVLRVHKNNNLAVVGQIVKKACGEGGKVAIIARTNSQISRISKELEKLGIEHSSTFFSASNDAKDKIINFIISLLSKDAYLVRNGMFTPFFPTEKGLQQAYILAEENHKEVADIESACLRFKDMRESLKSVHDLDKIFKDHILPLSINLGKDFSMSSIGVYDSYKESLNFLGAMDFSGLIDYLRTSDVMKDEGDGEKDVMVTSVHKSKGREYDFVLYLPLQIPSFKNFLDNVVGAILKSKGVTPNEGLDEENLRIDFVALTRAKKGLCVVSELAEDYYVKGFSVIADGENEVISDFENEIVSARDYVPKENGFLGENGSWILQYIRNHFNNLNSLSFSRVTDNPYEYLTRNILKVSESNEATLLGSKVHNVAKCLCENIPVESDLSEEELVYKENITKLLSSIRSSFSDFIKAEGEVKVPVTKLTSESLLPLRITESRISNLLFRGYVDAIFKNPSTGEFLIIDWKTDKNADSASKHRQQLEVYKKMFASMNNIPEQKIKVAIAYVGLKSAINTGQTDTLLDDRKPSSSAFGTFQKRLMKVLEWKSNPNSFLRDLTSKEQDDELWKSIKEQYLRA